MKYLAPHLSLSLSQKRVCGHVRGVASADEGPQTHHRSPRGRRRAGVRVDGEYLIHLHHFPEA